MKKTQFALIIGSFGLAMLLFLLDLGKISTSAGGVNIHFYPAGVFAVLGCVLLWPGFKKLTASN